MIESVLNRWRGTGEIFKISSVPITGNILYAVYIALVIGVVYYTIVYGFIDIDFSIYSIHIAFMLSEQTTAIIVGLISGGLYMLGESMGWGKWVGSLCYPESTTSLEARYVDDEGVRFPFIHKTANMIVKERENYLAYCNIALGIRGLYWWLPLMLFMAVIGITSYWAAILGSILLGIGFPMACYIARITKFEFTWWKISCVDAWERQEIVYGLFQGIALWYTVIFLA